jgi:hypothetical protein
MNLRTIIVTKAKHASKEYQNAWQRDEATTGVSFIDVGKEGAHS